MPAHPSKELRIGGLTPLTTIDFPDHLSCVIYCQGCSWRCRYCHNPELLPVKPACSSPSVDWQELIGFLQKRQSLLEAVVFSGGEPLLQSSLLGSIKQVKALGFKIGLHTAGAVPKRFAEVLPLLDWVGFDVKDLPDNADKIIQVEGAGLNNWRSLNHLLESGVNYECRTTVHWDLITEERLFDLTQKLADKGVVNYNIQFCRSQKMLDEKLGYSVKEAEKLEALKTRLISIMPGIQFI